MALMRANKRSTRAAPGICKCFEITNHPQSGRIKMSHVFRFALSKPCRDFINCSGKDEVKWWVKAGLLYPHSRIFDRIKPNRRIRLILTD